MSWWRIACNYLAGLQAEHAHVVLAVHGDESVRAELKLSYRGSPGWAEGNADSLVTEDVY